MNKINISSRTYLNLFFAFAFIVLLLSTYFSYKQIDKVKKSTEWIKHTHQVMQDSNKILIELIEVESATRGYLITNDPSFISNLEEKIKEIFEHFKTAKALIIDNPQQVELFEKLEPLLKERIRIIRKTIALMEENKFKENAQSAIREGQTITNEVIDNIHEIYNNEVFLLQQREEKFLNDFNINNIIFNGMIMINIIVLLIIIIFFNNLISDLIRSQGKAKKSESLLKGILGGSKEFIAALDLNYNFLVFNEAFENEFRTVFGKKPIIGESLKDKTAHMPAEHKKAIEIWGKALKGEEFTIIEEFGNQEANKYEITFSSIYNEDNQLIGASHIAREIGKRIEEEKKLKDFAEKLEISFREVERQSKEMAIINEMNNKMRSSASLDETLNIAILYLKKILPESSGIIYLINSTKKYLEAVGEWNDCSLFEKIFTPDQCWGLRQGKMYFFLDKNENILCKHCESQENQENQENQNNVTPYFCVPLLALNELIGVLFVQIPKRLKEKNEAINFYNNNNIMIQNLAGQIALSISNIRLHDALKIRSTRDILTNLQNRAYLDETFERDVQRAKRNNSLMAVIMLDLDHFKNINDSYGHESGDQVLREVAKILSIQLRKSDIACRYGGEEILIIMYDTNLEYATEKAEQLREIISKLEFHFVNDVVHVTASFGIAVFPNDADNPEELIKAADEALYLSKKAGRNKVTVYTRTPL